MVNPAQTFGIIGFVVSVNINCDSVNSLCIFGTLFCCVHRVWIFRGELVFEKPVVCCLYIYSTICTIIIISFTGDFFLPKLLDNAQH